MVKTTTVATILTDIFAINCLIRRRGRCFLSLLRGLCNHIFIRRRGLGFRRSLCRHKRLSYLTAPPVDTQGVFFVGTKYMTFIFAEIKYKLNNVSYIRRYKLQIKQCQLYSPR